jgi:hypothetical protein
MAIEKQCGEPEVANMWDKGPEPTDQLPNAELNPLLNPTLGRNLGRWAQVYFTSSPEKREEAVGELLRELKNETPAIAASQDRSAEGPANGAKLQLGVSCPGCQHQNEADERFCGNCGSPLPAGSATGVHRRGEAFAERNTSVDISPNPPGSNVQWLRDRVAISLEEREAPGYRRWTYLIVGLAILLAGFAYLQWAAPPQRVSTAPPSAVVPPVPARQPQFRPTEPAQTNGKPLAQEQEQVPPAGKTRTERTDQTAIATRGNISEKPSKTGSAASGYNLSADSASVPPAEASTAQGGGAQELLLAQRYLEGRHGPRDASEAAKWLWKAVGKQNADAALLLADLYTRGDGVAKSCDQARLLLVAALKKGASQAAPRLRSLESNGCQ